MKPKVYLESSVISYLTARPSRDLIVAANQQVTQEWWQEQRPNFDLYVSALVEREVAQGDEQAAAKRLEALEECAFLEMTPEAEALAARLLAEGVIPQTAVEDALHIAIATVNGMDYLLTWNFKHIANAALRANVEALCRRSGYEPPVICSPLELTEV
jgi:predicted nucleic acid-binding protein